MKELYESKISDVRWWLYDIPGNIGYAIMVLLYMQALPLWSN